MKRFLMVILVVIAFGLMAYAPLPQAEPGDIPGGLVIILTSVLIPVVIQVLKWIAAWFGVVWKEITITWVCFGLGVIVAFVWLMPVFPAFPFIAGSDPEGIVTNVMNWISGVLSVVGSVFGLATLIYRFILKAVFNALGLGNEKVNFLAFQKR